MKMQITRKLSWLLTILLVVTMLAIIPEKQLKAAVDFEAMPVPTLDTYQNGYHIARTMHLLETSTAANPNKVRIAVTGQSISDGNNVWVTQLIDYLKAKYPTAIIEFQNFAIGGFSSQLLYKRVPNDMASFFPDLVILYVYGDHTKYDRIVKNIREQTGAEVMMQTDHYTGVSDWSDQMSYTLLPEIAKKYGAELCRLREPWKKYLDDNKLLPSSLLKDDVHLNDDGQKFMLELMKQFFVYRESNAAQVITSQTKTIQPSDWVNGKLTIPFHGTRAEVISGTGQQYAASVKVDGLKPSDIKESYMTSREAKGMPTTHGIVSFNSVPKEQTWTTEITSYTNDDTFTVKASGSITGDEGTSANSILNGQHIKLDPESFIWHPGLAKPTAGTRYTFQTILNGTDTYNGSKKVLFSGLETKDHTLVLEATNAAQIPDIKAIRIYDPSVSVVTNETVPTYRPTIQPTPRSELLDNGNFEGEFTANMFGQNVDIPDGWAFWGGSSMTYIAGQGVDGSAAAKIKANTGSRSDVEISKDFVGKTFNFSAKIKLTTPAIDALSGLTLKLHAESKTQITVDNKAATQNYEVTADKKFVITNDLFGGSTDFVTITGVLKAPAASEIKDQNGTAFVPDYLSFQMWNNGNGGVYILDNMSLTVIESTPVPTQSPTPIPEVLAKPALKTKVNSSTTSVSGNYAKNGAVIRLKRGSKTIASATVAKGKFSIKIAKQVPGTKLMLSASMDGYTDSRGSSYTVALQNPTISKVKSGAKLVQGTAYKGSTVTVYVKSKKLGSKKATSGGKYSVRLSRKVAKGNTVNVKCKFGKYNSSSTYRVK